MPSWRGDRDASMSIHDAGYSRIDGIAAGFGDADDETEIFSRAAGAALDEREAFPTAVCRRLDALGVPAWYVPVRYGGSWRRHDELIHLVRTLSRRDLTVAVAHVKTFLGAVSVWLGGSEEQCRRLAGRVLAGAPVAWGLSEPDHGSDLMATETAAVSTSDGFRLTGRKQPVNNATRSELVCVLARTGADRDPRGLSLFLVDKRQLPDSTFRCRPKLLTHGIRGADISGIEFMAAPLGPDALIGRLGGGLETVLRALQLTRVMCTGLSLGAADHALSLAHRFAAHRRLYDRALIDMPQVRRSLGEHCARALLAESVGLLAGRLAHALPDELPVVSAVAKAFVPAVVDELVTGCAELLGARAFLTDVYAHGAFAKLERDHRIVSIFDGNAAVNRNALINHFAVLARGWRTGTAESALVRRAAALDTDLDDIRGLVLASRTGCSVVQALPAAVAELPGSLRPLGTALVNETDTLHKEMADQRPSVRGGTAEAFDLAARYEWCFAAASAIQIWLANQTGRSVGTDTAAVWWRDACWLRAVLTLAVCWLGHRLPQTAFTVFDELAQALSTAGAPTLLPTVDGPGGTS
jgi:alkylation response protein AidB-like acyl-CoA dehydrogenase